MSDGSTPAAAERAAEVTQRIRNGAIHDLVLFISLALAVTGLNFCSLVKGMVRDRRPNATNMQSISPFRACHGRKHICGCF